MATEVVTGGPPALIDGNNLVVGLPVGNCAFDRCVSMGTCALTTDNAGGGGVPGTNGVRRCGAVSSSTVGWGGEPDRAIDGNPDGSWGAGSCTHTDGAGSYDVPGTHWWQVDLGSSQAVDSVNIYHRTDCCQQRLLGATVYVSTTADYTRTGRSCGPVDDHLGDPDETSCNGISGRFVTVEQTDMVVTICELEVMGMDSSNPFGPPPPPPGGNPFGPPPPPAGGRVQSTSTVIATDGIAGYTTYQLSVSLGPGALNIYTIFGDHEHGPLVLPAAYQVPAPFGGDIMGVNPQFFAINPVSQYDSWITVGITNGGAGQISSIGIPWSSWTASSGIRAENGAVFWMDPNAGPTSGSIIVGQLTVASGFSPLDIQMDAQGKSLYGLDDWDSELTFSVLGNPGSAAPTGGGH